MRINCPLCGDRPLEEFVYRGDATVTRPLRMQCWRSGPTMSICVIIPKGPTASIGAMPWDAAAGWWWTGIRSPMRSAGSGKPARPGAAGHEQTAIPYRPGPPD